MNTDALGPVASKLTFLQQYLLSRAGDGGVLIPEPLSLEEMRQVAAVIEALVPTVSAMEERPIPLRLIQGGRSA